MKDKTRKMLQNLQNLKFVKAKYKTDLEKLWLHTKDGNLARIELILFPTIKKKTTYIRSMSKKGSYYFGNIKYLEHRLQTSRNIRN
jgi:hypothetical protein